MTAVLERVKVFHLLSVCIDTGLSLSVGISKDRSLSVDNDTALSLSKYRGVSLIRKRTPLGLYSSPMSSVLGGPSGVGVFSWAGYSCTDGDLSPS